MGDANLNLFRFMSEAYGIETFIETGSGNGATTARAVNIFPCIHTIELAKSLHEKVKRKLGRLVNCHHGASFEVLETILPTVYGPVLYWLDAHWALGPTAGKDEQCPILKELKEINKRDMNYDFILIDDAHDFFSPVVLKPPLAPEQWPNITEIFDELNKKDRYTVILSSFRCIKHGIPGGIVFPEDVIISVPMSAKEPLFDWLCSFNLEG